MKHVPQKSLTTSVLSMAWAASWLLAPSGCGSSTNNPVVADSGGYPSVDTAVPTVAFDAPSTRNDAGVIDAAPAHADIPALDATLVRADGVALDTVLVPADAAATETVSVRADGAASEAVFVGADSMAVDGAPPRADSATLGDTSPRVDAVVADNLLRGTDTAAPGCNLDGGPATFVHLTPVELRAILDSSENPYLINVKSASIANIPGTDAVLASDVAGIETLVGGDLCADIILYCLSGGTSQSVGTQLIAKGYRHVRDLAGGITAWAAAGYPTE